MSAARKLISQTFFRRVDEFAIGPRYAIKSFSCNTLFNEKPGGM